MTFFSRNYLSFFFKILSGGSW